MNKKFWKNAALYAGIVLFFIGLAYGFVPQVLDGKVVNQSDISGYMGMAQETQQWNSAHPDDRTAWTDSMFGGMPTTMLTGNGSGDWTQPVYNLLLTGKRPASYLLISLLGAFLLMLALGIHPLIAAGGAIAVTFCSYNMQIIQVGHNAKMLALAFVPWVLAAVIFTYRSALAGPNSAGKGVKASSVVAGSDATTASSAGADSASTSNPVTPDPGTSGAGAWREWVPRTVLGAALFALALGFQIKANHVQITYYLAIIIFSYVLVLLIDTLARNRKMFGRFAVASALLLVLGVIGIATNANRLIPTYLYTQETMRGGSDLSGGESKGLDLSYATSWSYGWEELPNMMIPDYNGGASAASVNPDKSETVKLLKRAWQSNARQVAKALPMYWGPQPFTAGPMYMGAITIFLFILGLGLCRGSERWWMLIPTIIGIFLALGNHFMPFTEFWYYHVPFYNKFRSVSMALIILQFTLPMLGFLVLDRILKRSYERKEFLKWGLVALAVTGGFCLLAMTGMGRSFTGSVDSGQPDMLVEALAADRLMLLRHDAWMSLILIVLTFGLLFWAYSGNDDASQRAASHSATQSGAAQQRASQQSATQTDALRFTRPLAAGVAICLLVLVNMFSVGKRYLNKDHFVTERAFKGQFVATPADKAILADPAPSYRVLDLTVNVFNDSRPSYFHKNIGGYSPVKLQRYQDLIDHYLSGEINSIYRASKGAKTVSEVQAALPQLPVLSMLNDKYIILDGNAAPLRNPSAQGPCWFVDSVVKASTPDEEIALLGEVDLSRVAVLGPDFADAVEDSSLALRMTECEKGDYIVMTSYAPNELRYHYHAKSDRVAVFSEVWYPRGWTAWIADGQTKGATGDSSRSLRMTEGKAGMTAGATGDSSRSLRMTEETADIELFRSNWTLRGAVLPAGDHDIVMCFDPPSYKLSSRISRASSIALILLVLLAMGGFFVPFAGKNGQKDE